MRLIFKCVCVYSFLNIFFILFFEYYLFIYLSLWHMKLHNQLSHK